MTFEEWMFILGFVSFVAFSGMKLYNIFMLGEWLELKKSFLVFIGCVVSYLVLTLITLFSIDDLLYFALYQFVTWYFVVNVLFLFVEIWFTMKDLPNPRKAYDPLKAKS